jgi:hypothetical protein
MRSNYPQLGLKLLIVASFAVYYQQSLTVSTAPTSLCYDNRDSPLRVNSGPAERRSAGHTQRQTSSQRLAATQSEPVRWDVDWRFFAGGAQGAEKPAFDDAAWRALDH